MSVTVEIPATIQSALDVPAKVTVEPGRVRDLIEELATVWPVIRPRLQTESGELHRFVNVYVGDTNIRQLQGLDTVIDDKQVLTILSAVSGG